MSDFARRKHFATCVKSVASDLVAGKIRLLAFQLHVDGAPGCAIGHALDRFGHKFDSQSFEREVEQALGPIPPSLFPYIKQVTLLSDSYSSIHGRADLAQEKELKGLVGAMDKLAVQLKKPPERAPKNKR